VGWLWGFLGSWVEGSGEGVFVVVVRWRQKVSRGERKGFGGFFSNCGELMTMEIADVKCDECDECDACCFGREGGDFGRIWGMEDGGWRDGVPAMT